MTTPIPGPTALPVIGNLLDLQGEPLERMEDMADVYGPIYRIRVGPSEAVFVTSFDIFDEVCDETRFFKVLSPGTEELGLKNNNGAAKGMFIIASEKDPDWRQAHRILLPAFGPLAIQGMFDGECTVVSVHVLGTAG